jgi:hypothetical protein
MHLPLTRHRDVGVKIPAPPFHSDTAYASSRFMKVKHMFSLQKIIPFPVHCGIGLFSVRPFPSPDMKRVKQEACHSIKIKQNQ